MTMTTLSRTLDGRTFEATVALLPSPPRLDGCPRDESTAHYVPGVVLTHIDRQVCARIVEGPPAPEAFAFIVRLMLGKPADLDPTQLTPAAWRTAGERVRALVSEPLVGPPGYPALTTIEVREVTGTEEAERLDSEQLEAVRRSAAAREASRAAAPRATGTGGQ